MKTKQLSALKVIADPVSPEMAGDIARLSEAILGINELAKYPDGAFSPDIITICKTAEVIISKYQPVEIANGVVAYQGNFRCNI